MKKEIGSTLLRDNERLELEEVVRQGMESTGMTRDEVIRKMKTHALLIVLKGIRIHVTTLDNTKGDLF